MRRSSVLTAFCLLSPLAALTAQESSDPRRAGPRTMLPRAREIALARSAAPASVSDSATIWTFSDTGYVIAVRGTTGAACYVSRSWPQSIEPHCFDAEGAASVMPIHMHEVLLLHRGMTPASADAELDARIAKGDFRLPARPAVSYMMSGAQELISDTGQPVGKWRPHLMIYFPFLDASAGGAREMDPRAAFVSGAGTNLSSIIIIAPEFVALREPVADRP